MVDDLTFQSNVLITVVKMNVTLIKGGFTFLRLRPSFKVVTAYLM